MAKKSTTSSKKKSGAEAATSPKAHKREAKPAEINLIEKGKVFAAKYLEQRDGLDAQLALDIVETMDVETINSLIEEANTAVIEKTVDWVVKPLEEAVQTILKRHEEQATPEVQGESVEPEKEFVNFLATPLATDETFAQMMFDCRSAGKVKLDKEKEYKSLKAELYNKMKAAGSMLVECIGVKMEAYTGYAVFLDEQKLIEAGVDPALIKKGWKKTPYPDVRMTAPKEPKA